MFEIKKEDSFRDERYILLPVTSFSNFLDHPLINHNYITELGYYPSAKHHFRERFEGAKETIMIYCLDGKGTIEFKNNKKVEMVRGSFFCIPKNTYHRYYADSLNPWSILWIHFNTTLDKSFPINQLQTIEINSPEKNNLLQNHFIHLFTLADMNYNLGNMSCISQLLILILSEAYLLDDGVSYDKKNRYLTKCIHYMNEKIDSDLTLIDFADYLKISPSYLSSIFKKYTQKSPIDFFIHLKMEQACKYLMIADLKVYEVAKKVGYQDPYYFSRIFKKVIGTSPKEYREKQIEFNNFVEFSH